MNNKEFFYRLKYFYFIPLEKLDNDLKDLHPPKTLKNHLTSTNRKSLVTLFDSIYDTIFKYSAPYSNFINPNINSETFFGEGTFPISRNALSSYYIGSADLINLSILHHCIIHSFFNFFSKSQGTSLQTTATKQNTYAMVAKNNYFFENGFFTVNTSPPPTKLEIKDAGDMHRAKYAQRYHTFVKLLDSYYSKQLLQATLNKLPEKPKTQRHKPNPHFEVPAFLTLWSNFLYSNKSVHHFDRALYNETSLLNIYGTLWSEKENLINNCKIPSDKLLLSYPLETTYGFHTLSGIAKLISDFEIHNTLNQKDYSVLMTDSFFNILKLLFKNPLVYNRHFLIRYACDAIMNGTFAESGYLNTKTTTVISKNAPMILSDSAKINTGLTLLEQYLSTITNLIIPLLTDLWDYACDKLELDQSYFKEYIDYYYTIITGNWCTLTAEDISSYHFNSTKDLRTQLMNTTFYPTTYKDNTYFKDALPTSDYYKLQLNNLMHYYPKLVKGLTYLYPPMSFSPTIYYPPELCNLFKYAPFDKSAFGLENIEIAISDCKKEHARLLKYISLIKS